MERRRRDDPFSAENQYSTKPKRRTKQENIDMYIEKSKTKPKKSGRSKSGNRSNKSRDIDQLLEEGGESIDMGDIGSAFKPLGLRPIQEISERLDLESQGPPDIYKSREELTKYGDPRHQKQNK